MPIHFQSSLPDIDASLALRRVVAGQHLHRSRRRSSVPRDSDEIARAARGGLDKSRIRETIPNMEDNDVDRRIAQRLKGLRAARGWSLDELARRSAVSRATLSRLENAEVSATASVLGKLCAAHGLTMSRLMHLVEDDFAPLVRRAAQPVWSDPQTGFRRRSVSPPARSLAAEALECTLDPGTRIAYHQPPRPGLEHHLLLLEGQLAVTVDARTHRLRPGDCLRYQLSGPSAFATPGQSGARYVLFMV
jgi:transcriptional regulator with XRE-family HTH domain